MEKTVVRLSTVDLVMAIVDPDLDVSSTYQTKLLETASGKLYHGIVVYESPDVTLLQTSAATTVRIAGDKIVSRRASSKSLMPAGLLDNATDQQIADLVAYLKPLGH